MRSERVKRDGGRWTTTERSGFGEGVTQTSCLESLSKLVARKAVVNAPTVDDQLHYTRSLAALLPV